MSQNSLNNLRRPIVSNPNTWPVIGLFAALLLVPAIAQLARIGGSNLENRTLAAFPTIGSWKEIKDLPQKADAYINDRFGLRAQLVHIHSVLRYRLGLSSSKDVVIGRDGWLFYTADRLMEQHTGANIFSPAELEN